MKFICSYYHNGAQWNVTLDAEDWADAEARVKKLGNLKLDGQLISTVQRIAELEKDRVRLDWLEFYKWQLMFCKDCEPIRQSIDAAMAPTPEAK